MSTLHMSYDDPAYSRQHDPASYDVGMSYELKSSSFLADQYMLDHLLHPLAPMSASHSMPYDMQPGFPSFSHMNSLPSAGHYSGDMHHPTPFRPMLSANVWQEATPRAFYPEPSAQQSQSYPPSSISQPSMFVPSSSHLSMSASTTSISDHSAPPPPWTMSGSLDPSTGIYQIAPEHPRIRTAQACEKCRGRKAKCSGEHPVCERCRVRGLKCEYAPERKMRGPNKIKRKLGQNSTSSSARSSRRESIASIASTASEASSFVSTGSESPEEHITSLSISPSFKPAERLTVDIDAAHLSYPQAEPSSSSSSASGSPVMGNLQFMEEHRERARPSHIDLSGTNLYDQFPEQYVPEDDTFASDISAFRRASLPSYLLESFSNQHLGRSPSLGHVYSPSRGVEVVESTPSRPHSSPSYIQYPSLMHPPIAENSTGSGSETSLSAPLTPPSIPSTDVEMLYPLDFNPDSVEFAGLDSPLDNIVDSWTTGDADIDATPRVDADGREKSLAQIESQFVHDS
ncbi:hypothetical protein BDW22DRAFT_1427939 [Trametopsis cervina]|nr:hypothetical protein BDW22DRAFT_1427939 [Trametopsis cervina]